MIRIDIIAVARLRTGALYDLCQEYEKRIQWNLNLHEVEVKNKKGAELIEQEGHKILSLLSSQAFVIVLDERGDGLKSLDFAKTLENLANSGENYIQFVIGGADGLSDEVRDQANLLLSFGQQTWPHHLARVMLYEQIYRAQQIIAGHPYHRE